MYTEILDEFVKLAEANSEEAEKLAERILKEAETSERNPRSFLGLKNYDSFEEYPSNKEVRTNAVNDFKNVAKYTIPSGAALGAILARKSNPVLGALTGGVAGTIPASLNMNIQKIRRDNAAAEKRYEGDPKAIRQGKAFGPQMADYFKSKREQKQASYIDMYNEFVKLAEAMTEDELEKFASEILDEMMIEKEASQGINKNLESYRPSMGREYQLNKKDIPAEDLAAYKQFFDERARAYFGGLAGGYTTYRGLKHFANPNSGLGLVGSIGLTAVGANALVDGLSRYNKIKQNNLTLDQVRQNYNAQ